MKTKEEILGIPSYPHERGRMIEVHTRQDALKAMQMSKLKEGVENEVPVFCSIRKRIFQLIDTTKP